MAFVNGFDHDLFVSYAHIDNNGLSEGDRGWVDELVLRLEKSLRQRLGGDENLLIYFDHRELAGNDQIENLVEVARRCAVFLAVASPAYAGRSWTRRELAGFSQASSDFGRLFAVECLPLDKGLDYPEPLAGHARMRFFEEADDNPNVFMPLSPDKAGVFNGKVQELADKIKKKLVEMNRDSEAKAIVRKVEEAIAEIPADGARETIVVAQTTDDIESERLQLRSFLASLGHEVLPVADYPQAGEPFKAAVAADLARAGLFVQLLSAAAGRRPQDLAEGYARAQLDLATRSGCKSILWRRHDLDLRNIHDPDQKRLLEHETVIASGFENFKIELKQLLKRRRDAVAKEAASPPKAASIAFINCTDVDADVAWRVFEEFKRNDITVSMCPLDGTPEEKREIFENILSVCDVVVLLHGRSTTSWVNATISHYVKIRGKNRARLVAHLVGPPHKTNDKIGFFLPELKRIESVEDWNLEGLISLVKETA